MGHDTHFLSRLARVASGHVQLAMGLYRDPELLKEVLSSAALPDGVERVAISLDDPADGPFLVVERNGHFVTCLGPGMRTEDLPLISKARLDAAASRLASLRERLDLARQVTSGGREPEMHPTWKKLLFRTEHFCREDVAALSTWMPVLAPLMLELLLKLTDTEFQKLPALSRKRGSPGARRQFAQTHARTLLARSTMAQLLLADPKGLARLSGDDEEKGRELAGDIFLMTCCELYVPSIARAINGVTRGGRSYLALVKRHQRFEALRPLVLEGLALSHEKCRAEVAKFLGGAWPFEDEEKRRAQYDQALEAARVAVFAATVFTWPSLREHFPGPETLPPHVACALCLSSPEFLGEDEDFSSLAALLPLYAGAPPEDLHLPHDLLESLPPLDLQAIGEEHIATFYEKGTPVVAEPRPGRNDPCPCGSGKKFKKCCGA